MAAKIKLTPEQLASQADSMKALSSQYNALFKNVNSTMKSMNANWSKNLSNNFSGKINTTQRAFSNIVSMLEHGATAANNSAKTMEGIDKSLAKTMNSENSTSKSGNKKTKKAKKPVPGTSDDFFHPSSISKEEAEKREKEFWDILDELGKTFKDIPFLRHLSTLISDIKDIRYNEGTLGQLSQYAIDYLVQAKEDLDHHDYQSALKNLINGLQLLRYSVVYTEFDVLSGGITSASADVTQAVYDKDASQVIINGVKVVSKIVGLFGEVLIL